MSRHRLAQPAAGACCAMPIVACAASPSGPSGTAGGHPASSKTGAAGAVMPADAIRWTIGPALVECTGVGPMWCLQYRDARGGAWKRHHGRIEGFEFPPGDEVELAVRFEAVPRPPADAPSGRTMAVRELARHTLTSDTLPSALAGSAWQLDAMPGATLAPAGAGGTPTLRFEAAARVSGGSGVNRFGARIDAGDGWLRVASPMVTRMAGTPEAMALEGEFLGRLQRAGHWRLAGDRLRLLDSAGAELMSMRRAAPAQGAR